LLNKKGVKIMSEYAVRRGSSKEIKVRYNIILEIMGRFPQRYHITSLNTPEGAYDWAYKMVMAEIKSPNIFHSKIEGDGRYGVVGFNIHRGLYSGLLGEKPIIKKILIEKKAMG